MRLGIGKKSDLMTALHQSSDQHVHDSLNAPIKLGGTGISGSTVMASRRRRTAHTPGVLVMLIADNAESDGQNIYKVDIFFSWPEESMLLSGQSYNDLPRSPRKQSLHRNPKKQNCQQYDPALLQFDTEREPRTTVLGCLSPTSGNPLTTSLSLM